MPVKKKKKPNQPVFHRKKRQTSNLSVCGFKVWWNFQCKILSNNQFFIFGVETQRQDKHYYVGLDHQSVWRKQTQCLTDRCLQRVKALSV